MDTILIIIGLLILGGGVAVYKFKLFAKPATKKPAKKGKSIVKKDDPFYEKNPDRDPLVKLAKEHEEKSSKKPYKGKKVYKKKKTIKSKK
tara:strand:- start:1718 stop:1987 length:270 start_codon:yes stop_codon:yes gene_type:complete